jgi:recombination protein RecT
MSTDTGPQQQEFIVTPVGTAEPATTQIRTEAAKTTQPAKAAPPSATSEITRIQRDMEAMIPQFKMALPHQISAERFMRIALTAVRRNPALLKCERASFLGALMTSAQIGLEPDSGPLGHAYLVPYTNRKKGIVECQLIIGYRGYAELAWRSGRIGYMDAAPVFEADIFEYERGMQPKLRHVPAETDDRGELRGAYAVAEVLGSSRMMCAYLTRKQIEERRSHSSSARSEYSPWTTDYPAMATKSAFRALSPWLPKSSDDRMSRALASDDADAELPPIQFPQIAPASETAKE